MIKPDSIVALSTPPGVGAIAIVRVSGEDSIKICDKIFIYKKSNKLSDQKSHTVHFGKIINNNNVLDEVLVTVFKAPHSYTGENTVEISCHGSNFIQQKLIDLLIQSGARLASPGEFTLRSFLNKKMDLNQAEAVADLISSENESSHKLAMQHMRKDFSNDLKKLREELVKFTSLIELELDFSDEDVEFADRKQFDSLLKKIHLELKMLVDSFNSGNVLKNGVSVAIAGKPNAGKSSLLRAMTRAKPKVADYPFTTINPSLGVVNLGYGESYVIADIPGLIEGAADGIGLGIQFLKHLSRTNILLHVVDIQNVEDDKITKELSEINYELEKFDEELSKKTQYIIFNKIDLLSSNQLVDIKNMIYKEYNKNKVFFTSAVNNNGIKELQNFILRELKKLND